MKKILSLFFCLSVVLLLVTACDSDSGSSGGSGADVDLSDYYTKAEVDSEISTAVSNAMPVIFEGGTDPTTHIDGGTLDGGTDDVKCNSFASAASFDVPSGAKACLFEITFTNDQQAVTYVNVKIGDSALSTQDFMLYSGYDGDIMLGEYRMMALVNADSFSTLYAWVSSTGGSAFGDDTSDKVTVFPMIWFK
ncbi:MAG TPA: hypothetical protein PK926_13150 [Spirochaetota bacterium]|mgnify:CR=1 FL=1|nr:hypothetical protein [Spirochaetota bacterium]HPI89990.1 hypothetical protein [Spirochaetota bacterium]HPR48425.1 hypothetical protein [Spirochaetota bacterium]